VKTDRTMPDNESYIIIRDNEKRTRLLLDIAVSGERNIIKTEAEMILKYKNHFNRIKKSVEYKRKN
jgi:hypothetical protein